MRALSPLEARVLGVLVEKQATVPDTYPLSLNALVAGCNQKTARWPVIEASDADVQQAVDGLRALSLVFEGSGSRVVKYEQNMAAALRLPGQSVALLAVLMLRGPQTSAELRQNTERLHRFADISAVEGFLDELTAKEPPRVTRLARAPGAREQRWEQLLCGPAEASALDDVVVAALSDALTDALTDESAQPAPAPSLRFFVPTEKKLTHEMIIPIRWGDMDAMGHVNNTVYFRYMEVARLDWLFRVGGRPDPLGTGPVIVNAFCNFIRQLEFPGDVLARHYVANPGRSSFDTYITLERSDTPGVVCAECGSKTVWTDFAAQKSVPLPDWMRALVS
jgi:uncharacterized protein YceH (UPF0502 family)/acyl-CoA thioesterase FadM